VSAGTGNRIRGNSIHSNSGLGIQNISGGNTELASPVITLVVVGSATGTACGSCTVDIFSDNDNEGRIYHGSTTASGGGSWSFPGSVSGPNVTATATNASGNTSEFTAPPPDNDADGLLNAVDNCPFVPNGAAEAGVPGIGNQTNSDAANQTAGFLFNGSPLPGDALGDACDDNDDNDGFSDADERLVYGVGAGSGQEITPCRTGAIADPWPPDTFPASTPDRVVDGQDLVAFLPAMFKALGEPGYLARLDIFEPEGTIDGQDLVSMLPFIFRACAAP